MLGAMDLPARALGQTPPLVVGGDHDYAPFEFIDAHGEPAGFNVEVMREIGRVLGIPVVFRLGPWAQVTAQFRAGELDVVPMFQSEERGRYADFTEPHAMLHHVLFVRRGSPGYRSLQDLAGREVIVQERAFAHDSLGGMDHGATLILAPTEPEALRLLASGRHDCALVTQVGGYDAVRRYGLDNLSSGSPPLLPRAYCLAVGKGRSDLVERLNAALAVVQSTGRHDAAYDRWIGHLAPRRESMRELAWRVSRVAMPLVLLAVAGLVWSLPFRRRVAHFQVAGCYAVFGALWILVTDMLVAHYLPDPRQSVWAQILKGWGYVLGSALILWLIVRSFLQRMKRAEATIARGSEELDRAELQLESLARFPAEDPNPVLRLRRDGTVLYANRVAETFLEEHGGGAGVPLPAPVRDLVGDLASHDRPITVEGEIDGRAFSIAVAPFPEAGYVNLYVRDITERNRAETRIAYLNAVLRGIRNVNQLITRENDRHSLISQACHLLVEARGFEAVLIGLADGAEAPVTDAAAAGLTGAPVPLPAQNRLPRCAVTALAEDRFVVHRPGDPPCTSCGVAACPFAPESVTLGLRHEGRIYGFLMAALPTGMADDPEEQGLLTEVAGDIAFALDAMRVKGERDAAEALTAQSQSSLEAVVETAPTLIVVTDGEGRLRRFNRACEEVTGYSRDEVLGRLVAEVLLPAGSPDAGPWSSADPRAPGFAGPVEAVWKTKAGQSITVEWRCTLLPAAAGEKPDRLGVGVDVTARRAMEEHLRQAQKMDAVGRLAGSVAHDFNNLLSVINGYADLALERLPPDHSLYAEIGEIRKAGEKASGLTRQLLAFSRKRKSGVKTFHLNDLIHDIQTILRHLLGEKTAMNMTLGEDLGCVMADPGGIEQVVLNLAVNARDAMPDGGVVSIGTERVDVDGDNAALHPGLRAGPYVLLTVSDTGIGMDADTLSRAFEPFFTTKEAGRGTGLGLSTVYGIVRQAGGCVHVTSEPGQGTCFRVYLPRTDESAADAAAAPTVVPAGGQETILLAEDDPAVRSLAERILTSAGYTVFTASEGGEALRLCDDPERSFDLLLTDVMMPGISGAELAKAVTQRVPGLRVLFMSGYAPGAMPRLGVGGKDAAFIGKPFTVMELLGAVRHALDAGRRPPA